MATAQVLFQRFYYCKSFIRHDFEVRGHPISDSAFATLSYFVQHVAMACLTLAAKIEECPRRLRDIINVFHALKQKHNSK